MITINILMELTDCDSNNLFRFVPFNTYSLQALIDEQFWLSKPDMLNDPFEGDFIIENLDDLYNDPSFQELLISEYGYDKIEKLNRTGIEQLIKKDSDYFDSFLYMHINNCVRRRFGTISFSRSCKMLKLWSHYADAHKGFVLIFDRSSLTQKISSGNVKIVDVIYGKLPKVKVYKSNAIIDFDDTELFANKLDEWESECEVRIIKRDNDELHDSERYLKFPMECLRGIIFGANMDINHILVLQKILKTKGNYYNKIKMFGAYKSANREKLIFKG